MDNFIIQCAAAAVTGAALLYAFTAGFCFGSLYEREVRSGPRRP